MKDESKFLRVAKQAALEAGRVILKYYGKYGQKSFKGGDKSDFATIADLDAEKTIIKVISKHFPDHNIITEESGSENKNSEYTWVIDPIDGSIAFVAGIPYFSISVGLLAENLPILGVIFQPKLNDLYWAEKGKGAWLNGKPIHVSAKNKLEEAGMVLEFGHNKKRQAKIDFYITPIITKIAYPYSFGSAVASMAMVATGILDGDVNQAWVWDFVAGAVIVREAGGMVTDFEGKEPDWSKERLSVVASNGLIHDQILEALR